MYVCTLLMYVQADIFDSQYLFIPVHDGSFHWTLLVNNHGDKYLNLIILLQVVKCSECKMMYYDSLNGTGTRYFMLMKYAKLQRFLNQMSMIWLFSETICQGKVKYVEKERQIGLNGVLYP